MLYRPPPIDTGPAWDFTAATISGIVVGVITSDTWIGLSCVMSLIVVGGVGCVTVVRTAPQPAIPYARPSVATIAKTNPMKTRRNQPPDSRYRGRIGPLRRVTFLSPRPRPRSSESGRSSNSENGDLRVRGRVGIS